MTGYGKSQVELPGKTISVEIRSLNSKMLDINFRAPVVYRERELEVRSIISQKLERGKIDVTLQMELKEEEPVITINQELALKYYRQIKDLATAIPEASLDEIVPALLRMPDILKTVKDEVSDEDWAGILRCIVHTQEEVDKFRITEGAVTERDIVSRIQRILDLLKLVEPFESQRINTFRTKFIAHLEELLPGQGYDANRLEQELIYYFEKLDITEEKLRLQKHCDYFMETLSDKESPGKKLGFIIQEIGREINTLGSKANDAQIQKIVVQMKDELEKIKEQMANIL